MSWQAQDHFVWTSECLFIQFLLPQRTLVLYIWAIVNPEYSCKSGVKNLPANHSQHHHDSFCCGSIRPQSLDQPLTLEGRACISTVSPDMNSYVSTVQHSLHRYPLCCHRTSLHSMSEGKVLNWLEQTPKGAIQVGVLRREGAGQQVSTIEVPACILCLMKKTYPSNVTKNSSNSTGCSEYFCHWLA